MFQEADVVAVILWLAEYYGAKAEIAAKCCRRIELLCQGIGSEANCEAAVNAGGCSAVMAALGLHSDDARPCGTPAVRLFEPLPAVAQHSVPRLSQREPQTTGSDASNALTTTKAVTVPI